MIRRLGVFWSTGALLATALVAVTTTGISAARAASFEDWASVSAGFFHTCGVRTNGKLYCWGSGGYGQIGDIGESPVPRRMGDFEDWASVSAGGIHTCGVRTNGKLYCWGNDDYGQIGDGAGTEAFTPRRIGSFEDWANVSAGTLHTCGVRTNGKLYCWGNDQSGQVGDGEGGPTTVTAPVRVGTFEDWDEVAAGDIHTCGIRRNGELYCWGSDGLGGQLGDGGANTETFSPRRIGTFEDWIYISAGEAHSCGVRRNGKLYCWGFDDHLQVGDGDAPGPATTPRRIGTFEDWANVDAGYEHTCAVRKNGKLYCWGDDAYEKLGDGDGNDSAPAPRRIGTFEDWANVNTGREHSCGVRSNGKLYCWGHDDIGQVGDGNNPTPASTPRRI